MTMQLRNLYNLSVTAFLLVFCSCVNKSKPVYNNELSELKNSIKQIEKISVEEGKQVGGFRQLEEIKEVEMNVLNKRSLLKAKKELVEILQEELDVHNVTTYID